MAYPETARVYSRFRNNLEIMRFESQVARDFVISSSAALKRLWWLASDLRKCQSAPSKYLNVLMSFSSQKFFFPSSCSKHKLSMSHGKQPFKKLQSRKMWSWGRVAKLGWELWGGFFLIWKSWITYHLDQEELYFWTSVHKPASITNCCWFFAMHLKSKYGSIMQVREGFLS